MQFKKLINKEKELALHIKQMANTLGLNLSEKTMTNNPLLVDSHSNYINYYKQIGFNQIEAENICLWFL